MRVTVACAMVSGPIRTAHLLTGPCVDDCMPDYSAACPLNWKDMGGGEWRFIVGVLGGIAPKAFVTGVCDAPLVGQLGQLVWRHSRLSIYVQTYGYHWCSTTPRYCKQCWHVSLLSSCSQVSSECACPPSNSSAALASGAQDCFAARPRTCASVPSDRMWRSLAMPAFV